MEYRHVGMFLLAKFTAYVILGFLLGAIGSTLLLTPKLMGLVQIGAGLFMLATAARIAELHPIFRYAVITPPRWAYKFLRRISHPFALGFFTILMPCGVTQATMAVAVASGNPWFGAGIMGAFILGTSPIFLFLGATFLSLLKRKAFRFVAAAVVVGFAVLSINGGIGLTGSFYTFGNIVKAATIDIDKLIRGGTSGGVTLGPDGRQYVTIDVASGGYTASTHVLKRGVPVRLTLKSDQARGCSRAFTIPEEGITRTLPVTGEELVEFTPMKNGPLAYTCSMGMFTGSFSVIP